MVIPIQVVIIHIVIRGNAAVECWGKPRLRDIQRECTQPWNAWKTALRLRNRGMGEGLGNASAVYPG